MAGKVANTLFHSGPDDNLLTVDAYQISDNSPKNNFFEPFNVTSANLIGEIRNNPAALDEIKSVLVNTSSKMLSKGEVLAQLGTQLNGIKPQLKTLTGSLTDTLVNAYNTNSALMKGVSDVSVKLGGAIQTFSGVAADEMKGLLSLAETQLAGVAEIELVDLTLQSLVTSSLLTDLTNKGLTEIATSVINGIGNPDVAKRSLLDALEGFVDKGMLPLVDLVIDRVGANTTLSERPALVSDILKGYRLPTNMGPSQYLAEETRLLNLLNKIDPQWSVLKRNIDWVSDLTPFVSASVDAITLFTHGTRFKTEALIAKEYGVKNQKQLVRSFYPRIGI